MTDEIALLDRARELGPSPALVQHDDVQLEHLVRTGAAALAAATCRWLELVAETVVRGIWSEHAARTPSQWLSWAIGLAPSTAREHVRVGLALRELPAVRDRFAEGTVSYSKVRAITRVATPHTEAMLLDWADGAPAHVLERIIRDSIRYERAAAAPQERDDLGVVRRWRADGTYELVVRVDGATGLQLEQHLDRLVDVRDTGSLDDGPTPPLEATTSPSPDAEHGAPTNACTRPRRAVREADAVVGALAAAVAAGPDDTSGLDRHLVVAHVDAAELAAAELAATAPATSGPSSAPAGAPTPLVTGAPASVGPAPARRVAAPPPDPASGAASAGAPVHDLRLAAASAEAAARRPSRDAAASADALRPVLGGAVLVRDSRGRMRVLARAWLDRLACTATRADVLDGADGGSVDLGRSTRRPDARLRRAVHARDRTCRFPGCGGSRWLVVHHVHWWSRGGPTDLDNLVLLCGHHHRAIHDRGWTLRSVGRGSWTFHAPADAAQRHPRAVVESLPRPPDATAPDGGPTVTLAALLAAAGAHAQDMAPDALQPQHWEGWYDHGDAVFVLMEQTHLATAGAAPRPVRDPVTPT